jgi:hypothetical protein
LVLETARMSVAVPDVMNGLSYSTAFIFSKHCAASLFTMTRNFSDTVSRGTLASSSKRTNPHSHFSLATSPVELCFLGCLFHFLSLVEWAKCMSSGGKTSTTRTRARCLQLTNGSVYVLYFSGVRTWR